MDLFALEHQHTIVMPGAHCLRGKRIQRPKKLGMDLCLGAPAHCHHAWCSLPAGKRIQGHPAT
eukprot:450051-Pelagomonas_calceolata.AAC.2